MTRSNILLWVNAFLLIACTHTKEEPVLELKLSRNNCDEYDTISLQVLMNNAPYTGIVSWNQSNIISSDNHYLFVASPVYADSISVDIMATVNGQHSTRKLVVYNSERRLPAVSYSATIQPLLTNNCNFSGCHANGSRAGKIELSRYDSVMQCVAPFNAASSLLYVAMVKTDPLRVMPPAGKLHDYIIDDVRVWIEQGAKNN